MVIPAYNNYVDKTRNARTMSEVRTLGTEISGYALDHGGLNPPGNNLTPIGRNNFLDPWKRPYVYLTTPALEDPSGTSLLNSDFDIYSKGIDGTGTPAGGNSGNRDDIVRSNNGAYVGLREAF
jgi:hypothetical protein